MNIATGPLRGRQWAVLACALAFFSVACRRTPSPTAPSPFKLYRFDDQLTSAAAVKAADVPSSSRLADPIVWKDFNSEKDVTWKLLRGRMGFRRGELVLKGEGSTPVIMAPSNPPVDWSRYESVLIRMVAEAGNEIKIKIGDVEMKQKLAPPMQYQVYRFDLNFTEPMFNWPFAIMPTDHLFAPVAIDFIELVPKKTSFPEAAGRQAIGKGDEYRNTIYAHSPSSISYEVSVPKNAKLHFGIGVMEKKPVTFRVLTGASNTELFSKKLDDPEIWEDAEVDLSSYEGRNVNLVFQTSAEAKGAVGLWANPLMTTAGPKPRPNVLIYMVCTLRPDHSSLFGYSRDTTPFLKKFGESAVVFNDCQAQATWTKPSVASMMTSLYSFTHGIINETDMIPAGATTVAQQMRATGYVSASIVANPFGGKTTGLDRGFDYIVEFPAVLRHREESVDRATDSAAVNHVALPWLEQHRDEPFFLYLLCTDPHAPYRPPAQYEAMFANPAETPQFDRDYDRLRTLRGYGGGAAISRAECRAKGIDPDTYHKRAVDRYDGEIAHNDHSFEVVISKLKELGILDNTLVVFLSDHGEEFWEHGWSAHGHTLYHELAHTVFLMRNPKLLPAPKRVDEPVQLIDVVPTILDLLGIQPEGVMEGQSLVPLVRGQPFQRKGPVMSSRFAHPNSKPGGLNENRTGTFALIDADWKLIYRDEAKRAGLNRIELYDRHVDRAETKNVASEHPDVVKQDMAEVEKWIEAQKQIRKLLGPGGKTTLDTQTIERLRSLGYLAGKPTQ